METVKIYSWKNSKYPYWYSTMLDYKEGSICGKGTDVQSSIDNFFVQLKSELRKGL